MSYIRSLSNPEGLYIIGSSKGIDIWHTVKPPLSSKWPKSGETPWINVPTYVFHHVLNRWAEGFRDKVSYRGLVVEEVQVCPTTGKPPKPQSLTKMLDPRTPRSEFLIRLQYKEQFFHMWRVTWEYIVHRNDWRPKGRPKKARGKAR